MLSREYYEMEQDLFRKIENEKKFSLHKLLMLIELRSLSMHKSF